jgi:predicted PurR-regulated permease PerM
MSHPAEVRRVTQLLFYGAVFLLAFLLYRIVEPFLVQIGWAAVLAICVHPFHARLARRFGDSRGALLSTLVVAALLVVPAVFVAAAILNEGSAAVASLQEADRSGALAKAQQAWDWSRAHLPLPPAEEIKSRIAEGVGRVAAGVAARAGGLLKNVALFLFDVVMTLFILFFLLRDARAVAAATSRMLPFDDEQRERLVVLARDLVSASVTASLSIAAVQGLLGGIAFAILGIQAPVLWGVVMAVASLLPLVGSGLVWAPAAVWLLVSGSTLRGLVLLGLGALVISNVDNVLRPMLLSGRAQMSTLLIFISLMGGVSAFGFIGMVLGPLVTATALALFESYLPPPEPAPAPAPAGTDAAP